MNVHARPPRVVTQRPILPLREKHLGTRGRIVDVALKQFSTRGYAATSMRDLATDLGLQAGALYVHFPSKEHILDELVRVGHEEHHRGLREALLNSSADPIAQISAVVRAHVRFHTDYAMLAVLIQDELHSLTAGLGAAAMAIRRASVAVIEDVIARGIARKQFDVPHVFVATAAIGAMGMRVAHWFGPDFELDADEIASAHVELALRMLKARG